MSFSKDDTYFLGEIEEERLERSQAISFILKRDDIEFSIKLYKNNH